MLWIGLGICVLGLLVSIRMLINWDKNCDLVESLKKKKRRVS